MIRAVVFDMDGVIVSSEELWDEVRRELVSERGGRCAPGTQEAMMGLSTPEWTAYMRDELGVAMEPEAIEAEVVRRLGDRYRELLPLLPGAVGAVRAAAERWPLAVASSSPRALIALVLELAGLADAFAATVSSEEVARGKPAPDVYLAALARLGVAPGDAAAVEDSANGIRAARAAGMRVVAVPNPRYPPPPDAVALADAIVPEPSRLTPDVIAGTAGGSGLSPEA